MSKWFYLAEGKETGPIDSAALKRLAISGHLQPSDKVRRGDLAEWLTARQVTGLFKDVLPPDNGLSRPEPENLPESSFRPTNLPANKTSSLFNVLVVCAGFGGCLVLGLAVAMMLKLGSGNSDAQQLVTPLEKTTANSDVEKPNLRNNQTPIKDSSSTKLQPDVSPGPGKDASDDASAQQAAGTTTDPQDGIVEVQAFLEAYRRLRKDPRLKLLKYSDQCQIEWRCFIHGTDLVGLPYVFAHLPTSSEAQLELMIHTADETLPNRLWPKLLDLRNQGLHPYLEITVKGAITAYYPAQSASGTDPATPPRVNIVNASITEVQTQNTWQTPRGSHLADVTAAKAFLNDWKSVDNNDRDGTLWLRRQLVQLGYLRNEVRWRCVLREKGDAVYADLYHATPNDPRLSFSPQDRDRIVNLVGSEKYDAWSKGYFAGVETKGLQLPPVEVVVVGRPIGIDPLGRRIDMGDAEMIEVVAAKLSSSGLEVSRQPHDTAEVMSRHRGWQLSDVVIVQVNDFTLHFNKKLSQFDRREWDDGPGLQFADRDWKDRSKYFEQCALAARGANPKIAELSEMYEDSVYFPLSVPGRKFLESEGSIAWPGRAFGREHEVRILGWRVRDVKRLAEKEANDDKRGAYKAVIENLQFLIGQLEFEQKEYDAYDVWTVEWKGAAKLK